MERESMLIYKSFVDVSEGLNDADYRRFWNAIHRYGLYGEDIPKFGNPVMDALVTLIRPLIRANIKNYENGLKGGAPKGNSNAQKNNPKTTQKQPRVNSGLNKKTTQKQGNVNVNVNDTDNVTDNVNENDNDNDNVNVTVNVNKELCPFIDDEGYITDWDKFQDWKANHPNAIMEDG